MAQQYEVVFPKTGRATFDGGLSNKFPRTVIAQNESPDCLNVVFVNGAAETRKGTSKLNTTAVATAVGDGLYTRHDNTGTETMVVFAAGSMWQLTGASTFTTVASAQSVFTAGVRVATAEYQNNMFIGNGGVTPYKYDGTYFTRHGVPAPTATATVASAGTVGAVAPGAWFYAYTYVNSAVVEGNISPLSASFTVSAGSGTNVLAGIGVAPASYGIATRRVYRASTSAGPWLRIGTISNNTASGFTDNVSIASATVTAPTDNGEPPNYNSVVLHQNRLFCTDPANQNYVRYSNLLEPYTFASTNFVPIGDASYDLVRGVVQYNNGVLVLCANGLYLIDMPSADPLDWVTIKIVSQYGSKSPFATFLYDNKIMLAAMQNSKFAGFAAIQGSTIDPERTYLQATTESSDLKTDRIEPDMFLVQETYAGHIAALVFKNKAYVALPYDTGATTNNRAYVFDFSHTNLTKQGYAWSPLTGITPAQFAVYGGNLYYLDAAATGFVYQMEKTAYADEGTAINSYFWTKEFSGNPGHENLEKDFRKVNLLVEKAGAYYMGLTYRTDSDKGAGQTIQISLDPGTALWGTLIWGMGNWGGGKDQEEVTISLGQTFGKRIQFKFSNLNVANRSFKVHGLNFTYNVKGRR